MNLLKIIYKHSFNYYIAYVIFMDVSVNLLNLFLKFVLVLQQREGNLE